MNNGPLNTNPGMTERLRKSRERIEERQAGEETLARERVAVESGFSRIAQ